MSEEDYKLELPDEVLPPTEQAIEEPKEEIIQEEVSESQSEYSEAEQAAMEQGWRPPSEFDEEGKEAISADEFLRRGELFDKIKDLKSQYRRDTHRLEGQVKELGEMMKDERKRGYDQALADLSARRAEAVEIGDLDAFNSLDSEYNRVRDQKAELEQKAFSTPSVPEVPVEVKNFQQKNADWFNSNTPENNTMVTQAVQIDEHLAASQPYLTDQQRLDKVEGEIKKLYPHRFSNPKKQQPAAVESATVAAPAASSQQGTKIKFSDLDERQKAACEQFLSLDPDVTVEDYLSSLEQGLKMRHQL